MTNLEKLLFAYDGSAYADAALDDLQHAGLPQEVEVLVLSVADLWLPPDSEEVVTAPRVPPSASVVEARATAAKMIDEAKVLAARAGERIQALFPSWQVHTESVADSPAWALVLRAQEWQADLIVVGSQGYSPLERLVLGSVSQTVLAQAPCSVRVARASGTGSDHPLRILVGVDGSTESELAVRIVAERNWPVGTNIRIVTATNPSLLSAVASSVLPSESSTDNGDTNVELRIDRLLEESIEVIRQGSPHTSVSKEVKRGDPKRILVDEAKLWGADCIFIGSRGLGRWQRLLLGSVSTAVAARAHCSVEVVRPPLTPSPYTFNG